MIGLIDCYPDLHTKGPPYSDYESFINNLFADNTPPLKVFHVTTSKFPDIDECDGYIISGSSRSIYEDEKWMKNLLNFISQCHQKKKKLLGICFGHQAIALALGGKVIKSEKGWEVGAHSFDIISKAPWMQPEKDSLTLLFSHKDQVVELPPGTTLLGKNAFCPIQMYRIGEHIFSLQAHPEFIPDFLNEVINSRIELIGKEKSQMAIKSLTLPTDHQIIATWMLNFLKN